MWICERFLTLTIYAYFYSICHLCKKILKVVKVSLTELNINTTSIKVF